MKPKHTSSIIILLLSLLGCKTAIAPMLLTTVAAIAGDAAEWGVRAYPQHRAAFVAAQEGLNGLIDSQTWDSAAFSAALSKIPVLSAGLAGPQGDIYLRGAVTIFRVASGLAYSVTSEPALQQCMISVRDGLARGLAFAAVPPAPLTRSLASPAPMPSYTPRAHPTRSIPL
jgi:hypothetical protein